MNNTVLVESKLRQKLKLTCTLLCVFCLCAIAVLVCVAMICNKNLNGQVTEATGTLDKVYETESNVLTLHDGKDYNVVWSKDIDVDMNDFKGKTVTLVVTQETFAGANPWVLGLVVDNKTFVDYRDTLDYQTKSNNEVKTIVIIVTAVLCAATCGVFIWRFNVKPVVERELYKEFGEFLSLRQPTCPERKITVVYSCVYIALIFALLFTSIILDPDSETMTELATAAEVVLWILIGVSAIGLIGLVVLLNWTTRREIDFYAKNLPFDFYDISHAQLRKKVKAQLQQELLKDRQLHPDTYADGGNGYDVTFEENGVSLVAQYDNNEPEPLPEAEDVFTYNDNAVSKNTNAIRLSYEQLNLEAVAYYRKGNRPMMIIVKSRLTRSNVFPEEFVNDIHIPFDSNLQHTLQKFNVKVENLDYLLENKKRLMLENCLIVGKNKGKMQE